MRPYIHSCARSRDIELQNAKLGIFIGISNEFARIDVHMIICRHIINSAVSDADKMGRKIWPKVNRRRTVGLLRKARSVLGIFIEHCIMGTHV